MVEVIVAATVFVVGVLALLGVMANATRLLGSGDRATTGTFYAQQRLETLQATDCATLAPGSETKANVYDLKWTVQSTFGGNSQFVRVIVSYPSYNGSPRQDTVETSVLCVR